jgi:hypothetical protein
MGSNKAYGEGDEIMEECVKPIIIHIYAEGHLIDLPNIPVYLGMYNGNYLVINSVTKYPISVAEKEVIALVFARARKMYETKKTIVSRILKVDTNLWNWGDIFLVESNNELYPIDEPQKTFEFKPFRQIYSSLPNSYWNGECMIAFDKCEKFPLYVNLELCMYDNFHFFVLKQFKDGIAYIFQSPLLFDKMNGKSHKGG